MCEMNFLILFEVLLSIIVQYQGANGAGCRVSQPVLGAGFSRQSQQPHDLLPMASCREGGCVSPTGVGRATTPDQPAGGRFARMLPPPSLAQGGRKAKPPLGP